LNTTKYEVLNRTILQIWEKNQIVDPQELIIFNETTIIIKEKHTLMTYDIAEDRTLEMFNQNAVLNMSASEVAS
jgi:hypothetical protein